MSINVLLTLVEQYKEAAQLIEAAQAEQEQLKPPGQPVASKKLLFSAVRKYRFMKSDDAFSHGFAMP